MISRKTKKVVASIEDTSILRKFTVLFLLMSLIPTIILYYFYLQVRDQGRIEISEANFNVTLMIVVIGVFVGYTAMRSVLKQLMELTIANKKVLEKVLSPDKIEELGSQENEIAILAQSFSAVTTRLEENIRSLEIAKKTLHAVMTKVGHGISNMQNIDTFLELILETVTGAMSGQYGILMVGDEHLKNFRIKMAYSPKEILQNVGPIRISEKSAIYSVILTKQPLVIMEDTSEMVEGRGWEYLFPSPMICAPLMMKDHVRGLLMVNGRRTQHPYSEDEKDLLFNLACQTAVALENANLNEDIEKTYFETISALALAVDAKDRYSRGHLDRVAKYTEQLGRQLGLEETEIRTLREAARLHDIGKIGIPDEILKKEGALSEQEWEQMRSHTLIGESIIKPIRSLQHLCDIVRHHHEKLDGTGYPDGLMGDEISPLVRITTVADIYDALTTDRPYRKAYEREKAFGKMREMQEQIDQDIVEALYESFLHKNAKP